MAKEINKLRIGILGSSGYTGVELIRILEKHPIAEIVLLTADSKAGQPLSKIFPHLNGLNLPELTSLSQVKWENISLDVVFSALPHGKSQSVVSLLLDRGIKVIDLAADFRLTDQKVYEQWYGHKHESPSLLSNTIYGLTEFNRNEIKHSSLIACPGCYPTASLIPLIPLLEESCIQKNRIIVDAKSGVTGAGRAEKLDNLFPEISEAMHPYSIAQHRHIPEIEQALSIASEKDVSITFTPHIVPMNRGIIATIYAELEEGVSQLTAKSILTTKFCDEPFVSVLDGDIVPQTRMVRGSNVCAINIFMDRIANQVIIVSAIDNLLKGASGQAIQNFNCMFGIDETTGLNARALFP